LIHRTISEKANVGGGIFPTHFSIEIPHFSPNPGTKLTPNKKQLQFGILIV